MEFGQKNNRQGEVSFNNNNVERSWASKVRDIRQETEGMSKEEVVDNYVDAMAKYNVLREKNKEDNENKILEQKDRAFALAAVHSSISLDENVNEKIAKREKELLVRK